ncbi:tyrosine-type recombinase/integrase [Campylobacter gastrosuis]|uniref:Tyrosine-type recombinase/integrase n=1 Tax=Campylobacter gastrosuis TaxID=2974576 RepID=A0ABT7HNM5_9BACT|nr:tyrosine-type recombinase/integrase [Campylobacter gastrosuis]MDL0088511.1 tyrosine-type recombinase/integrase [Campylobacter gastrosuis]
MPKINTPLSDAKIRTLKAKDKIYKISDGGSLYLFIHPDGKKHFAFEYKSPITNKTRRLAIGYYPDTTLAYARTKRTELIRQIQNGEDPLISKKASKNTLKEVILKWLDIKSASIEPSYLKKQILIANKHIFPYLGDMAMDKITAVQIIDTLKIIERAGTIETIKRVFMLLSQTYKYAVSYQLAPHNITADINFKYTFKAKKEKHFPTLTSPKEIKILLDLVKTYSGDIKTKTALKLAIYTAMRPFNIRHASWDEFDLKNGIWQVPAQKMKMKEAFMLPLSTQVITLLDEYKKFSTHNYLFAGLTPLRPMSENTMNAALRRLGYTKDELVSHGFRAMFSTAANELRNEHKISADIIERCLAHKDRDKVRSAYNRASNLKEMRQLMQWWADYLDDLSKQI